MIAWLKGCIVDRTEPGKLVVDVHGVGYDLDVSLTAFFQVEHQNDPQIFYIHTLVREDAFLLYGFIDKAERALFRHLIKVNGVGPKLAMTILSSILPNEFMRCITDGDLNRLIKCPGIGRKTAERLLVEMKDKLHSLPLEYPTHLNPQVLSAKDEAIAALEALGYKRPEAAKWVQKLDDGQKSVEQLIRQTLQSLA